MRAGIVVCLLGLAAAASAQADEEQVASGEALARPDPDGRVTEVKYFVFVIDIDDIDGANQNFAANVYVQLNWRDPRLVSETSVTRRLPLAGIWTPRVLLANKQGIVRSSMPLVAEVMPDGTVSYRQRYVGRFSQPLDLSQFPMDSHRFTIQFVGVGYTDEELQFVPGTPRADIDYVGGAMADRLSVPDWRIESYQTTAAPYQPVPGVAVPAFAFEFTASRHVLYYIWQVIIPLGLIVMMAWTAFWIDPTNAGAQIGVATSSVLTLIAYRFVLGNLLPRLPYMTRLDYFTLGSTLLVFLALVEVIVTAALALGAHRKLSRRIDWAARIVFPACFTLLLVFSLLV